MSECALDFAREAESAGDRREAPILSVEGVAKRFGAVAALDGVSFEIRPGEFFALLGPSGCGKTTLMRLIAGFGEPDKGRIRLAGRDMAGTPPYRRPVNMMFQSYALFPHLSIFENIAFGLRRQGRPRAEIAERVEGLLAVVRLSGLGARKPDQLSGGQKQRVALARALAPGPALLLLDEPLGALDRQLREETQFQLKEIQRKLETSFVVVTHDQDEAMVMADRIAVMRAGRIEQIGAPPVIYNEPSTRFVASFIGQTNFIDGRIERDGSAARIVTKWGAIGCPARSLAHGARAALAVRPERVRVLAPGGEASPEDGAGIEAVVEDAAFRGETTHLRARTRSGETLRASLSENGARFAAGDVVRLFIAAGAGVPFADDSSADA